MATLIPFKGILYNTDKINDLSAVTAPPYDVISEEEQDAFHECHPRNVIRLILGKSGEDDTCDDNCHTRAADCFNNWLAEDILISDETPAFYLTSIEFSVENQMMTRFGLIARVRIEPFEKGVVLPHERTFSKVRSERLDLMKRCHSNFSPIFSLYSDQNGVLDSLRTAVADKAPDTAFTDGKGHHHKLWRITAPAMHESVSNAMKDKRIFIADGHHRYETALDYRDWVAENTPDFSDDHPANYVMMYLSSMEDPGMLILPAHRMLKEIEDSVLEGFVRKAGQYFDITTIPYGSNGHANGRARLISELKANAAVNAIGVSMKDTRDLHLMTLKPDVMSELFGDELPDALRGLDVTVLTRLIFMEILGFDQARLDNADLIAYSSIAEDAIEGANNGQCDISFILNPTRIEQVQDIAQKGLIMPRKSTYFYPKVITGQVMNDLKEVRSGKWEVGSDRGNVPTFPLSL